MLVQAGEFVVELRIGRGFAVIGRKFIEGPNQGFGHVAAAKRAITPVGVGNINTCGHFSTSEGLPSSRRRTKGHQRLPAHKLWGTWIVVFRPMPVKWTNPPPRCFSMNGRRLGKPLTK